MCTTTVTRSTTSARSRALPHAASCVLVGSLFLGGCIVTRVELIGHDRGIRLAGSRFSGPGENDETLVFTWNEERKAYVHEFEGGLVQVRFARLKGDTYLGQAQKQETPPSQSLDPSDQYGYAVGFVRLAGSRLSVAWTPNCPGVGDDVGALAPRYGVEYQYGAGGASVKGTRAALLGWLGALAECRSGEPGGFLDIERFTPGGPELAARP